MLKARLERIERRLAGLKGRDEKCAEIVYGLVNGEYGFYRNVGGRKRALFIISRPGANLKAPIEKPNAGGHNSHGGEK